MQVCRAQSGAAHLELRSGFADSGEQAAGAEHRVALALGQLAYLGALRLRQLLVTYATGVQGQCH